MTSPLSSLPPEKIRDLDRGYLLQQLGNYFHATPPEKIVETDYSLWRCAETGFEFCEPRLPGNVPFYEWVSSFPTYYPGFRWEYGEVSRLLKQTPLPGDFKILDVGCGKGDFLRSLDFLTPTQKHAIDLNKPAIEACRAQGFKAYCGTVAEALVEGFFREREFAAVTSFHCLEHVDAPVEFVRELLRATAPGGKLFLSTPYSPMSFEDGWFDVMNHPPHHMTRWNLAAYRRVAEILGVKMRHFAPRNRVWKQALLSFHLETYGPNTPVSKGTLLKDLALKFPRFLATWRRLAERAAKHEVGGSDLILVEFTAS